MKNTENAGKTTVRITGDSVSIYGDLSNVFVDGEQLSGCGVFHKGSSTFSPECFRGDEEAEYVTPTKNHF